MKPLRPVVLNTLLALLVAVMAMASLWWGESSINVPAALADWWAGAHSIGAVIMGQLRLPRMLLALMVGGTLGLSGAVLQGYLRNPLADPGLLGVSGGAALGAVCVFYTGLFQIASALLPLGGLAGALVTAMLLVALVGRGGLWCCYWPVRLSAVLLPPLRRWCSIWCPAPMPRLKLCTGLWGL